MKSKTHVIAPTLLKFQAHIIFLRQISSHATCGTSIEYYGHSVLRHGWPGFGSLMGLGIFLFTAASRPALEPTRPPIQWLTGALSLGVKRLGREADHSPQFSAEVKIAWSYISTPQYAFMAWCSVKAQGQLYLN
jgi:hypothetical protein